MLPWCGDGVGNSIEEKSVVFCLMWMC